MVRLGATYGRVQIRIDCNQFCDDPVLPRLVPDQFTFNYQNAEWILELVRRKVCPDQNQMCPNWWEITKCASTVGQRLLAYCELSWSAQQTNKEEKTTTNNPSTLVLLASCVGVTLTLHCTCMGLARSDLGSVYMSTFVLRLVLPRSKWPKPPPKQLLEKLVLSSLVANVDSKFKSDRSKINLIKCSPDEAYAWSVAAQNSTVAVAALTMRMNMLTNYTCRHWQPLMTILLCHSK